MSGATLYNGKAERGALEVSEAKLQMLKNIGSFGEVNDLIGRRRERMEYLG